MLKSIYTIDSLAMLSDNDNSIDYVGGNAVVFAECDMQPMDGLMLRGKIYKKAQA